MNEEFGGTQVFEPTQYELLSVGIITAEGVFSEQKFKVQDLNIYESIFNSVVSGDVVIKDTENVLTRLGMCGTEHIFINFKNPDQVPYKRFFRIYKISDLSLQTTQTYIYKIHFCSEEFLVNQKVRVSKSYNGLRNDEIILDILQNYLNVSEEKLKTIESSKFEQTLNAQKFIIPNLKPFEAINLLCSFSINTEQTSAFLFYETNTEFHFTSLSNLYKVNPVKVYRVSPQYSITDENRIYNARTSISRFEFPQTFNSLETLATGGFSSSMIKLDLVNQQQEVLKFNPINNYFELLNSSLPFNDAPMRVNGGETLDMGSAYQKYFINFQSDLTDKWLLQRAAQLSLLNNCRLTLNAVGDSGLRVGDVVYIDIPDFMAVDKSSDINTDKLKSGKYLVTSLRHRIIDNKYYNELQLCKDSNIGAIPNSQYSELYEIAAKS